MIDLYEAKPKKIVAIQLDFKHQSTNLNIEQVVELCTHGGIDISSISITKSIYPEQRSLKLVYLNGSEITLTADHLMYMFLYDGKLIACTDDEMINQYGLTQYKPDDY